MHEGCGSYSQLVVNFCKLSSSLEDKSHTYCSMLQILFKETMKCKQKLEHLYPTIKSVILINLMNFKMTFIVNIIDNSCG